MAFRRKSSRVIAEALTRLANLKAIDPDLDLGNGLTVAAFETQINKTQTSEDTYNGQLAQADAGGQYLQSG
ncbi:hypothetical protein [Candidatus Electrothrix sp.]|uniref:hypothetical protein n=1 Tax=Candidatus Electrothrix sp. TaxID=2170559 RepID=UPI0040570B1B